MPNDPTIEEVREAIKTQVDVALARMIRDNDKLPKAKNWHLDRRWRVDFTNLVYDDGFCSWSRGYRTRLGAYVAAFWNFKIASYGGDGITITDNDSSSNRDESQVRRFICNDCGKRLFAARLLDKCHGCGGHSLSEITS